MIISYFTISRNTSDYPKDLTILKCNLILNKISFCIFIDLLHCVYSVIDSLHTVYSPFTENMDLNYNIIVLIMGLIRNIRKQLYKLSVAITTLLII